MMAPPTSSPQFKVVKPSKKTAATSRKISRGLVTAPSSDTNQPASTPVSFEKIAFVGRLGHWPPPGFNIDILPGSRPTAVALDNRRIEQGLRDSAAARARAPASSASKIGSSLDGTGDVAGQDLAVVRKQTVESARAESEDLSSAEEESAETTSDLETDSNSSMSTETASEIAMLETLEHIISRVKELRRATRKNLRAVQKALKDVREENGAMIEEAVGVVEEELRWNLHRQD